MDIVFLFSIKGQDFVVDLCAFTSSESVSSMTELYQIYMSIVKKSLKCS